MKRYRICCIEPGGRIVHAFDLACRDDLHALEEGESVCEKTGVEIWDGSRLVARIKQGNAPLATQDHHSL